jgi:hypothetical protein
MKRRLYVRAAAVPVPYPAPHQRRHLTSAAWVPADAYWLRRLADGSVVAAPPPADSALLDEES